MWRWFFVLSFISQSAGASRAPVLTPHVIGEIDFGTLQGQPRQLAPSPDGSQIYLQTFEPMPGGTVGKLFHYLLSASTGGLESIDAEPAWASTYWEWKSAKTAPDDPQFAIDLEQTKKILSATNIGGGGAMALGASDPGRGGQSVESVAAAAQQSQTVAVYTLRLKGQVIGEFVNEPLVPGLTFGWGPAGSHFIAYAEHDGGRLVVMDNTGAMHTVDATKNVILPAWSANGHRLIYLEGRGKKKYAVVIADVSPAR